MDRDISRLISVSSWFVTLQIITLSAFLGCAAIVYLQIQELRNLVLAAPTLSGAEPIKEVEGWQQYVRAHNATTTLGDTTVTILEFTDFQCPY